MKILFTGLPYFGKTLVAELNETDSENTYVFCDTYYSKKDRFRFLWHLLSAKKVVSFNGVTSESGSLNWVLKFKRELIMQWHGSDVLTAKENRSAGKFTRKYVDYARSYTDAVWLKNELAELNIDAQELQFKHVKPTSSRTPFKSVDVLTYLAREAEEFYGLQHFLRLADEFPDTVFHVVGSDGKSLQQKKNVIYHGWIAEEKFQEKLNSYAIFIRLTKHDGYSLSVLRAIANGNYVIWNNPHEAVDYVSDANNIESQFKNLTDQIKQNKNARNENAIAWAEKNLDRKKILNTYIEAILK